MSTPYYAVHDNFIRSSYAAKPDPTVGLEGELAGALDTG
jgi:hypothetical protein